MQKRRKAAVDSIDQWVAPIFPDTEIDRASRTHEQMSLIREDDKAVFPVSVWRIFRVSRR